MKRKFSQNLIWKAMEFARAAREELGDALGDEHVERMFDAFDPSLRRQIFMEMLMTHTGGVMRVKLVDSNNRNRVAAVKAIRWVARLGLKEAVEVTNAADEGVGVIEGNWSSEKYNELKRELVNTGYELV